MRSIWQYIGKCPVPLAIALLLAGLACVFALTLHAFLFNVSILAAYLTWVLFVD